MTSPYNIILKDTLKPAGGPSGYLYNLKISLKQNNISSISLLSYGEEVKEKPSKKKPLKEFIKSLKVKLLPIFLREKHLRKKETKEYKNFYASIEDKLKNSKINLFHNTKDFYYFKKMYPKNTSISLLMSHSPEPSHTELYQVYLGDGYTKKQALYLSKHLKEINIFAFNSADYIIFPCKEAVSPYDDFFKEFNINRDKLRFILTSSQVLEKKLSSTEFKKEHNINTNKILFAYVGRKTKIKGYDIFCKAAKLLENDNRFLFIAAGNGPIPTPKLNNLIDFGWTNDPGSIINAVDYLIVPNRDTYFDLGVIQAFSLNTALLTTATGGNRWFIDKDLDINFFNPDANDLAKTIQKLNKPTGEKNRIFFDNYLDNRHFALNYLKLFQEIDS